MKTLVIIPAYNEALNISKTIYRLIETVPKVDYVVINDCSTDNTTEILNANGFSYISLPVNLDIGGVVQTGYKYGIANGYDIIIQHDGDGQHDPMYIKDVCTPIENGEAFGDPDPCVWLVCRIPSADFCRAYHPHRYCLSPSGKDTYTCSKCSSAGETGKRYKKK